MAQDAYLIFVERTFVPVVSMSSSDPLSAYVQDRSVELYLVYVFFSSRPVALVYVSACIFPVQLPLSFIGDDNLFPSFLMPFSS